MLVSSFDNFKFLMKLFRVFASKWILLLQSKRVCWDLNLNPQFYVSDYLNYNKKPEIKPSQNQQSQFHQIKYSQSKSLIIIFNIKTMHLEAKQNSHSILTKQEYLRRNPQKRQQYLKISDKFETQSLQTVESSLMIENVSLRDSKIKKDYLNRQDSVIKREAKNNHHYIADDSIITKIQGLSIDEPRIQQGLSRAQKRNLIVNWISLIHTKYWFEQETLHLAVNILDRYLQKQQHIPIDFQLLGITSFWMASKIQERKLKELKVWIKLGKGFEKQQIIQMEARILETLDYQLIRTTSQAMLWQTIHNSTNFTQKQIHLCLYVLELSLLDYKYVSYDSRVISLSCVYLCCKIQGLQEFSHDLHNQFLSYWNQVRRCSRKLCKTIQKQFGNLKSPIVRKYASSKLNRVSGIRFGKKSDSLLSVNQTLNSQK